MTNIASNWVRSLSEQSKKWSNYWKQTQSKLNSGRSTEQVGLKSYLEVLLSTQDGWTSVGREFHILGLLSDCLGPRNNKSPVVGGPEGWSTGNSRCACQTFSWTVLPMAALYTGSRILKVLLSRILSRCRSLRRGVIVAISTGDYCMNRKHHWHELWSTYYCVDFFLESLDLSAASFRSPW